MDKCYQIVDSTNLRTGVAIVGQSMTGKTTLVQILSKTFERLVELYPKSRYNTISFEKLNPKSIEIL